MVRTGFLTSFPPFLPFPLYQIPTMSTHLHIFPGGFSGFTNPLGVSPKDVNGLVLNGIASAGNMNGINGLNGVNGVGGVNGGQGVTTVSMKGESPPSDLATKQ